MKKASLNIILAAVAALALTNGCVAVRSSVREVDLNQKKHFDADFDATDLRSTTESVAEELLASPFLAKQSKPPIMMVAGVENRTTQYVDTKSLTDRIRTILIRSGKVQFINAARRDDLLREQGYQAAHATPETQAAIGKQLGAKYMLSGSLTEMRKKTPRQVRLSRKEWNYYKLTMEVTDLETGLITWTTEKEIMRQASKPLIGW